MDIQLFLMLCMFLQGELVEVGKSETLTEMVNAILLNIYSFYFFS